MRGPMTDLAPILFLRGTRWLRSEGQISRLTKSSETEVATEKFVQILVIFISIHFDCDSSQQMRSYQRFIVFQIFILQDLWLGSLTD